MDYRNLKRIFVVNKALRLWRKSSGIDLTEGQMCLLIALSTRNSFHLVELREYMRRFGRAMSDNVLNKYLKRFVSLGYVEAFGHWPVRYKLTIDGINALQALEKRCRETRYDK